MGVAATQTAKCNGGYELRWEPEPCSNILIYLLRTFMCYLPWQTNAVLVQLPSSVHSTWVSTDDVIS